LNHRVGEIDIKIKPITIVFHGGVVVALRVLNSDVIATISPESDRASRIGSKSSVVVGNAIFNDTAVNSTHHETATRRLELARISKIVREGRIANHDILHGFGWGIR